MAVKRGGLGRGFESLFNDNSTEGAGEAGVTTLRISELVPNRSQPRREFAQEDLDALTESIKSVGVLQPLLVRPLSDGTYQIVAGERRWRAAGQAGLSEVPVVIRALSDSETQLFALVENLQRKDLNPLEQAEGIRDLINKYGFTQDQVAMRVGISRPAVTNVLRLLELPPKTAAMVRSGEISAGHGRTLLPLKDPNLIQALATEIKNQGMSVRETEKRVASMLAVKKVRAQRRQSTGGKYAVYQAAIAEAMGRKVEIKAPAGKKGGAITIEFFDEDDLKALVKKFGEE